MISVAPQLATLVPYTAQLTALSKAVPPIGHRPGAARIASELGRRWQKANILASCGRLHVGACTGRTVLDPAEAKAVSQWKTWWWICFGGIIFFLLSIPLLRGRWRPKDARRDEAEHEAMVQAELAKLGTNV